MIDAALATLLRQVTGLADRVTPSDELVPVTQGLPRVVYTLLNNPRQYTDDGPIGERVARVQIDVFADDMGAAQVMAARITAPANDPVPEKRGLDGYRGTQPGVAIRRIAFPDERPGPVQKIEGQNQQVARYLLDTTVWYRATPV